MLQEELRNINITVIASDDNPKLSWSAEGLSGIETLGIMAATIFDMYSQLFDAPDRPYFDGVKSRVCIEYDGENVAIAYRPEADIYQAQGLTMAALAALCKRATQEGFNPLEGVLGAIMSPVTKSACKQSRM